MMSNTPYMTAPRMAATIPATTRTTAMIHKMNSMADGYPRAGRAKPTRSRAGGGQRARSAIP